MKKLITLLALAFCLNGKAQTQTDIYDFAETATSGAYSNGSLISDGTYLYGMTYKGGVNTYGTVFKIKPDGSDYIDLYDFAGNDTSGVYPNSSLYSDGIYLYGMTTEGGPNYVGTVFKIRSDGTGYADLYNFANNTTSGSNPPGSLISDGTYLYGVTSNGGAYSYGTIFKIKPDGTNYIDLYDFANDTTSGSNPSGSLISDGTYLYGMTTEGGVNTNGTVFKIKLDGTNYTDLYDFEDDTISGAMPYGSLYSDGTYLYGMTTEGGPNYLGTIFKIKPDGTSYTDLYNFAGNTTSGSYPNGSLIGDGTYLYGMTQRGGANGDGTIFKIACYNPITISVNSGTVCTNGSFTLNPSGANTYTYAPSGPIVTLNVSGTYSYSVTGTDTNGCVSAPVISTLTVSSACFAGIDRLADIDNQIIIYPNPNNGSFVIEPQNTLYNVHCTVYDVNGRVVLTQIINGKTNIDASSLNEGVYNISLISNEGVVNKRLVIVR